ncbi:MFS transporter [Paraburkholderia hospita]|uniref:MFS transporter n=2 Tax=Paraburkholderia hospita TaxID=169430 RepID=A0AAN1MNP6_9BURK|nr:MFS transporter [Paraburkholderia hospita]AUT73646.1 MFS transporter [Paraburkholderia hospita]OUL72811.1 MFS transporter [Paraburkholderia hospita]OUL97220.1 MFS transporter [Paraburkholderia hospita]SEH73137.1 Sugar transporter [Paraburkholderia hospita]
MSQLSAATEGAPVGRSEAGASPSMRDVVAVVAGNALEFYDFTVYAFFSVFIGRAFFPSFSPATQIIASVAVFGVGFVARPVGGVIIGAYADRRGRKAALTLTFGMMALGTAIIAFTPTYAHIGIFAPLLVVVGRLLQGLSAGGEAGPATSYLLETAAAGRRGLYTSWQLATQGIAALMGGLVGYTVSSLLSADALAAWGWRIPFMLGLLIAPLGIYIRRRLHETLDVTHAVTSNRELLRGIVDTHMTELVLACCVLIGPTITVYVVGHYMTTYGIRVLHLPTSTSMLVGFVTGGVGIVASLAAGVYFDRFPRSRLLIVPQFLSILAVVPMFTWVLHAGTGGVFLGMVGFLTLLRVLMSPFHLCVIPEIFPQAIRSTCVSICYSVPTTLFGGTAQLVVAWLATITPNPMAPAWYLLVANAISFGAVFALDRRRRARLAAGASA